MRKISAAIAIIALALALASCDTHDHIWDTGHITAMPSSTTAVDGVVTYTCVDCGETKTQPIGYANNIAYRGIGSGKCEIIGIGNCTYKHIIIPSTMGGMTVTKISDFAFEEARAKLESDGSGIAAVVFPDTLLEIGDSAFYRCMDLETAIIPDSVTTIGEYAFGLNVLVKTFGSPSGLVSIGDKAFMYCESLESFTLPNSVTSVGDGVFNHCGKMTNAVVFNNRLVRAGEDADHAAIIPSGITSIDNGAVSGSMTIVSATIPTTVGTLGEDAFSTSWSLGSIVVPEGVEVIPDGCFGLCFYMTSVTLPATVTSFGKDAFSCDRSLVDIYYSGTQAQFASISKGIDWRYDVPETCVVHCSDTDVAISTFPANAAAD